MAKHQETQFDLLTQASYLIRYLDPELLHVCLNALNGQPELAHRLKSYRGKLSKGDILKRKIVQELLEEIIPKLDLPTIFGVRGAIEYQLVWIEELRERAKHVPEGEKLEIQSPVRGMRGMGYYERKYITSPTSGRRNGPYLYYRHQKGSIKGSKYVCNLSPLGGSKRKLFK